MQVFSCVFFSCYLTSILLTGTSDTRMVVSSGRDVWQGGQSGMGMPDDRSRSKVLVGRDGMSSK